MKCATPDLAAWVAAPPSSSKLTSSPVTVFTTSGPVMNMYELPSAIRPQSGIAGEELALGVLALAGLLAARVTGLVPQGLEAPPFAFCRLNLACHGRERIARPTRHVARVPPPSDWRRPRGADAEASGTSSTAEAANATFVRPTTQAATLGTRHRASSFSCAAVRPRASARWTPLGDDRAADPV